MSIVLARNTLWTLGLTASIASSAQAADLQADPTNYVSQLGKLQPGDTLHLAAGTYTKQLNITNLNGSPQAYVVITGPDSGAPAIFVGNACCNTVEFVNSSYVAVRNLTIDAQHIAGVFGVSAKGATGNLVHHIRIENNSFLNHDGSQQTVAISTKTPTWGWEIRGNSIVSAGTGLYLGNSDGSSPFVAGLIEGNLIRDTIGYNGEIKFQNPRPTVPGMPTTPSTTIIRDNVFCKNDQPSPDGDRPNFLVGGFPSTGPGSEDRYEIYRNFFYHNPRESLLQVSGRVTVHDNLFVDVVGNAVLAQNHDLPLRQAYIYNNTIYSAGSGIRFGSAAVQGDAVIGNLVLAAMPIVGTIANQKDNLTAPVAMGATLLQKPAIVLSGSSFLPLPSQAVGSPLDLSMFSADTDWQYDFAGTSKGSQRFRGAYASDGNNPGWQPACDRKPVVMPGTPGNPPDMAGTVATGCSCDVGGSRGSIPSGSGLVALVLATVFAPLRARARRRRGSV